MARRIAGSPGRDEPPSVERGRGTCNERRGIAARIGDDSHELERVAGDQDGLLSAAAASAAMNLLLDQASTEVYRSRDLSRHTSNA